MLFLFSPDQQACKTGTWRSALTNRYNKILITVQPHLFSIFLLFPVKVVHQNYWNHFKAHIKLEKNEIESKCFLVDCWMESVSINNSLCSQLRPETDLSRLYKRNFFYGWLIVAQYYFVSFRSFGLVNYQELNLWVWTWDLSSEDLWSLE